jgi:hypothetical protein
MALNADRKHDRRQGCNGRKDEEIGTLNSPVHDLEIFSQGKRENGDEETSSPIAK